MTSSTSISDVIKLFFKQRIILNMQMKLMTNLLLIKIRWRFWECRQNLGNNFRTFFFTYQFLILKNMQISCKNFNQSESSPNISIIELLTDIRPLLSDTRRVKTLPQASWSHLGDEQWGDPCNIRTHFEISWMLTWRCKSFSK